MARRKKGLKPQNLIIGAIVVFLVVKAISQQLSLPPGERTWQGSVFGIPYDFRFPTIERLRNTFWNENSSQLIVPQAFGVGWTLNLYPLLYPRSEGRLHEKG